MVNKQDEVNNIYYEFIASGNMGGLSSVIGWLGLIGGLIIGE